MIRIPTTTVVVWPWLIEIGTVQNGVFARNFFYPRYYLIFLLACLSLGQQAENKSSLVVCFGKGFELSILFDYCSPGPRDSMLNKRHILEENNQVSRLGHHIR